MPTDRRDQKDKALPGQRGLTAKKKEAMESFAELFDGSDDKPTPEKIVVDVMHGKGDNTITERQFEAAKVLLPYRLPKLNNVEAHVATEAMTAEEWINTIDEMDEDDG